MDYPSKLQQNPTMPLGTHNSSRPDPAFESALAALKASGMSEWSSLGTLYATWPSETVNLGHQLLTEEEEAEIIGDALAEVGSQCPTAAQEMFSKYIAQSQFTDLCLPNADWLTDLPTSLVVPDYFYLAGCSVPSFHSIVLIVGGTFVLDECPNIQKLPNELTIGNCLWINNCNSLVAIPEALDLLGDLEIGECNALIDLPPGLTVNGDLMICDCGSFQALPLDLHVSKSLSVRRCSSWDGLIPALASIGELIHTDAYPDGLSLIEWRRLHKP